MTAREQVDHDRADVAIEAAADALLAVCALQTGTEPKPAALRAIAAITDVYERAEREAKLMTRAMVTLAGVTLAAVLLTVITVARYEALRQETLTACDTAARLDLTAFTQLCRDVGYQQTMNLATMTELPTCTTTDRYACRVVMPEDLDR